MNDRLSRYREKRKADSTPEPVGGAAAAADPEGAPGSVGRPGRFVVQLHAARSLHFDLRLEHGGVLLSWAVPKGPSFDPAEKRFAVQTEDHPLDYADFEGVIPEGNYGAGAMIVWDRGVWVPHLDPAEGFETGKQLFELKGHKLRGMWTLVRLKSGESGREWLLIKERDGWARTDDGLPPASVLSGLTVEELAAGESRTAEIAAALEEAGAPRRAVPVDRFQPMLAESGEAPFSREGWLFELKYDGYRLLAATGEAAGEGAMPGPMPGPMAGPGRRVRLGYRSGRDATAVFPELARAVAALPYPSLLLDGEVVVLDDDARPSFGRLQKRALLTRRADVERATVEHPAVYQVFDLPAFAGFDLRPLPLATRKELLRRVLPAAGPLRYCDHVETRGEELYAAARAQGLEGLIAKRADASYRAGRSADWLKLRAETTGDFVVVGFTEPKGSAPGLGAVHLAWLTGDRLVYAGRAGSGFGDQDRRDLRARLEAMARPEPPTAPPAPGEPAPPRGREHTWVEPRLVAEVRYIEVTEAGQLRHPVFVRLRDDKPPGECVRPASAAPGGDAGEPPEAPPEEVPEAPERPPLSNLDKVFWPGGPDGEGRFTKGDLVAWYETTAPFLLPYLADRPVVLDRYPDGIAGKSFFQKNAPDHVPGWVRTEAVWSEDGAETRYVVCDDLPTLLYLANLGTIPLHLGASRFAAPQHPDWSILDLDAKDAPFAAACEVALAVRRLTARAGLPAYVKTSGASGLHVLIPLGARLTHEQSRQLAEVLARLVAAELPAVASVARLPRSRQGKVYVDYLQNGWGKLLVAPYSARPLPGAPVSMPLAWDEVAPGLDPRDFTLATAPRRLAAWDGDPLRPVLGEAPDLTAALARLVASLE